jgi:hypothetical protein
VSAQHPLHAQAWTHPDDRFDSDQRLRRGAVTMELVYLGEGHDGDYDPDDPGDVALLRVHVFAELGDRHLNVADASYCPQVPVGTPGPVLRALLSHMMSTAGPVIGAGLQELDEPEGLSNGDEVHAGARRVMAELSWVSPATVGA